MKAEWMEAAGKTGGTGWVRHHDLMAARAFTAASPEHTRLFDLLKTPGTLTLKGQLDLYLMLRTAIQPGATLDFEYPSETVTVILKSAGKLNLKPAASATIQRVGDQELRVTTVSSTNKWLPIELTMATGSAEPRLDVAWISSEDTRPRPMLTRRFLLPWATPRTDNAPSARDRRIPEIAGGDWTRGQAIFSGEKAACAKCHQMRGVGGMIGPDLSNLVYRD